MEKTPESAKHTSDEDDDDDEVESTTSSGSSTSNDEQSVKDEGQQESSKKKDSREPKDLASYFTKETDKNDYLPTDSKEEVLPGDISLEEEGLSETEAHESVEAIVEARIHELSQELDAADVDSQEEFEAIADAAFIDSLRSSIEPGIDFTSELIDEAFGEAVADLSLKNSRELPGSDGPIANFEVSDEQVDTVGAEGPTTTTHQEEPIDITSGPGILLSGSGDGSINPPRAPISWKSWPSSEGHTSSTGNIPNNAVQSTSPELPDIDLLLNRSRRKHLLVGGIVGYIIGRRAGRKRTERKLNPDMEKLEYQVSQLHDAVLAKEEQIRGLARVNFLTTGPLSNLEVEEINSRRKSKAEVKNAVKARERMIHSKSATIETIGSLNMKSLKIFHEKRLTPENSSTQERKSVETMTKNELIEVLGDLEVNGVTVLEMFKSGRIKEPALRQIAKKYLRGGNYEKTLFEELRTGPQEFLSPRDSIISASSNIVQNSSSSEDASNSSIYAQSSTSPALNPSNSHTLERVHSFRVKKSAVFWGVSATLIITASVLLLITLT